MHRDDNDKEEKENEKNFILDNLVKKVSKKSDNEDKEKNENEKHIISKTTNTESEFTT